MASYREKKTT
ncbi:hypothetical protein F383_22031 [Gossypium arboreum]|uniref:Uncharacterized protein n=1 Tax=Gossypium arboreum TaxID=29729 RepID=A0A0B0MPB2_GOSAR|nr:hypothetical protein F383_22031 [Gossypium arboreum]